MQSWVQVEPESVERRVGCPQREKVEQREELRELARAFAAQVPLVQASLPLSEWRGRLLEPASVERLALSEQVRPEPVPRAGVLRRQVRVPPPRVERRAQLVAPAVLLELVAPEEQLPVEESEPLPEVAWMRRERGLAGGLLVAPSAWGLAEPEPALVPPLLARARWLLPGRSPPLHSRRRSHPHRGSGKW